MYSFESSTLTILDIKCPFYALGRYKAPSKATFSVPWVILRLLRLRFKVGNIEFGKITVGKLAVAPNYG